MPESSSSSILNTTNLKDIIAAAHCHDHEEFYVSSRGKSFTTTKVFMKNALPGQMTK
jgi:hypothetical protein